MRPARAVIMLVLTAAVAVAGCSAHAPSVSTPVAAPPSHSAAAPPASNPSPTIPTPPTQAPTTAPSQAPVTAPSAPVPSGRPATGRCEASALRGVDLGSEGAAGTIWVTIELRNISTSTCALRAVPGVRLLGAQGQPVTPPSLAFDPAGGRLPLVTVRPGGAVRFAFGASDVCDATVAGARIRLTVAPGMPSLVVPLGERLETCRAIQVQRLEPLGS